MLILPKLRGCPNIFLIPFFYFKEFFPAGGYPGLPSAKHPGGCPADQDDAEAIAQDGWTRLGPTDDFR